MTDQEKDQIENEEESFAELFEKSYTQTGRLKPGEKVEARVLKISADWVFLDIGSKGEGVLDRKELLDDEGALKVAEGDSITAWFMGSKRNELVFTTKMGGAAAQNQLADAYAAGIPVDGVVEKEIKGGFEIKIGGVRAFCPYSQISLRRTEDATQLIGKHLPFRIAEYGERGRNIVVSHRAVLEEDVRRQKEALKETLHEGDVVKGTIASVRDFGAFVDIGGIHGLIPISEIGWTRVEDIRERLSVGQEVEASIKQIDWEKDKITLSLKDTLVDPWQRASELFPEGSFHTGTIARLAAFGAFVTLSEGIDGLIHISRLGAGKRINHPKEVVSEGQSVEVKVESVDKENRKLSLSLASVARAADEEEATMTDFRRKAEDTAGKSMGTLGDLLKAKLKK